MQNHRQHNNNVPIPPPNNAKHACTLARLHARLLGARAGAQPMLVLHELSHALHDRLPPALQAEITRVYKAAMDAGAGGRTGGRAGLCAHGFACVHVACVACVHVGAARRGVAQSEKAAQALNETCHAWSAPRVRLAIASKHATNCIHPSRTTVRLRHRHKNK